MPVKYDTYRRISVAIDPGCPSYYWPPVSSGCGQRGPLMRGSTSSLTPDPAPKWYEPFTEFTTKSPPISGRSGGTPPYHMTPYWVSTVRHRNYLTQRLCASNGFRYYKQVGQVRRINGTCTPEVLAVESSELLAPKWMEQSHTNNWTNYTISSFDYSRVADAVEQVKSDVSIAALTSYDALTELAEIRELPGLISSTSKSLTSILKTMLRAHGAEAMRLGSRMTPRKLLRHTSKALRKLGGDWMTYRYGIMPLVYSYRDMIKLSERGAETTTRKSIRLQPESTGVSLPSSSTNYRWTSVEGEYHIRGCVYQWFSSDGVARLSSVGVNPLVTAWELMPYSFVIDWFLNVGDYIHLKTTPIMSQSIYACISRRVRLTTKVHVHFKDDSYTITYPNRLNTDWWGANPPSNPSERINRPEEDQLLSEVETDEYQRDLFWVRDVQPNASFSMNWKRYLDASVMSTSQLSALLKRIR